MIQGNTDEYVQIGVTAMRDRRSGGYLTPEPLYIKANASAATDDTWLRSLAALAAECLKKSRCGDGMDTDQP